MNPWPLGTLLSVLLVAPTASATNASSSGAVPPGAVPAATSAPRNTGLAVRTVLTGLDQPWDLTFLSSTSFLFTERDRKQVWLGTTSGGKRLVGTSAGLWNGGETGLMSIERAPDFASSGDFFTCHGFGTDASHDVRVARWHLDKARTRARVVDTVVKNLPSTSGRHGGCALAFGGGGALFIGTGDAATGSNPRNLRSGGGKVLRVDARSGKGWPSNPYASSSYAMKRRVYTFGHRNVQGLARGQGRMWSVEQGSYRDDEVNLLKRGADYGWNPVPGYNESVPMTDHALPGAQRSARWRSGSTTVAATTGAWLYGSRWGKWSGKVLAMTTLKDESLRLLRFDKDHRLTWQATPTALDGRYGRLRAAVVGPDGALWLTTSNANGTNKLLRVTRAS